MSESYVFKVIVAGQGGVGKTALIQRYCTGTFIEDHKMTIGADFSMKKVDLDTGETVKLQLWDFAGEERFRFVLGPYCKGATGALVCYDITDYDTFAGIPEWLRIIRKNAGMIPVILVGTKYDLPNHEVELGIADKYAEDAKCIQNVWCSSKSDVNIEPIFYALSQWLIYYINQEEQK
ncbi:MAG: GTP-binding protein [Candidatus Lokiarchaeota archaeon]|nr:GTP-binding protein [Candidatus Lokiarchaeota archaeon]